MTGTDMRERNPHDWWLVQYVPDRLWWRPDGKGYTPHLHEAGLYTQAEAEAVAKRRSGGGEDAIDVALPFMQVVRTAPDGTVGDALRQWLPSGPPATKRIEDYFTTPKWRHSVTGTPKLVEPPGDGSPERPFRLTMGSECCVREALHGGLELMVYGWTDQPITNGHFVLLSHRTGETSRYQLAEVARYADPPDMWHGLARFAPRSAAHSDNAVHAGGRT